MAESYWENGDLVKKIPLLIGKVSGKAEGKGQRAKRIQL